MRKPSKVEPPSSITPKQPANVITQVREYKLITPLCGGGVHPTEADPITVVRATEIRGHLRFWWRACRGGQFDSLEAMKKAEDEIWGKAYKKEKKAKGKTASQDDERRDTSQKQTIQIVVEPIKRGKEVEVFIEGKSDKGERISKFVASPEVPPQSQYAVFALQHSKEDFRNQEEELSPRVVYANVRFRLTISFPSQRSKDVEAALWAWETFGGIGARTRRGFGALCLFKVNGDASIQPHHSDDANGVIQWIKDRLSDDEFVVSETPSTDTPHLSKNTQFLVTPSSDTSTLAWANLIDALYRFRQKKDQNRSIWPEGKAIRAIDQGKHHTPEKFPRAAFGLPIIFHFIGNKAPEDTTLKEAGEEGEKRERFASPLILRPLMCSDNRAVGLALLLDNSRVDIQNLTLAIKEKEPQSVRGDLTQVEASNIRVLEDEPDVLKAFMRFLEADTRRRR